MRFRRGNRYNAGIMNRGEAYRPSLSHLALSLILLLAAALRLYALDGQSFWADEGNSVVLATRSPGEIVHAAAADIHPPGYYLLLAGWGSLVGLGEVGARSLSAVLGVLVVAGVYRLGRMLSEPGTALLAATLTATNPFLVYYSQEARMYQMLTLTAVVAAIGLVVAVGEEGRSRWGWVLYAGAAVMGLYTHYAFPLHLLALNAAYLLSLLRGETRGRILPWLLGNAAAGLAFLPWLPVALRQLTTWPAPAQVLSPLQALRTTAYLFLCGPTGCPGSPAYFFLLALLAGILVVLLGLMTVRRGGSTVFAVLLSATWLVLPVSAMLLFGIFSPVFLKFLLIVTPAYLVLAALGLEWLAGWGQRHGKAAGNELGQRSRKGLALLLFLLIATSNLLALDRYYHDPEVARDDYRSIAAYLKTVATADDAVILNAPGQIDAFGQYDHGAAPVHPLPASRPPDPSLTLAELERIVARSRRIYAIYWATDQSDPDGLIENYLAAHTFKAWDTWVGHLRFVAYNAEPPPETTPFVRPPRFGRDILLDAVGLAAQDLHPGDIAQVLLRWAPTADIDARYKVTLQLLDPARQVMAQVDSEPVGGSRPTSGWRAFDLIDDPYGLPIPLATPPVSYELILALYDAESGTRLPVTTGEGVSDHLSLGTVTVHPPAQAPPPAVLPIRYRAEKRLGTVTFLGYNRYKQGFGHAPDTPLMPGDTLHITTFWRAEEKLYDDLAFELLLDDLPLGRYPLAGPAYPTSAWLPDLPWRGEYSVVLPAEAANGRRHRLALRLVGSDGQILSDTLRLQPDLVY
ncbi:MAG: hypothetical protein D6775_05005 [Caldilineae bacterium]|nr:MAG: hypothetical protein D6775_05005 [Caldilineae bacterium]